MQAIWSNFSDLVMFRFNGCGFLVAVVVAVQMMVA